MKFTTTLQVDGRIVEMHHDLTKSEVQKVLTHECETTGLIHSATRAFPGKAVVLAGPTGLAQYTLVIEGTSTLSSMYLSAYKKSTFAHDNSIDNFENFFTGMQFDAKVRANGADYHNMTDADVNDVQNLIHIEFPSGHLAHMNFMPLPSNGLKLTKREGKLAHTLVIYGKNPLSLDYLKSFYSAFERGCCSITQFSTLFN